MFKHPEPILPLRGPAENMNGGVPRRHFNAYESDEFTVNQIVCFAQNIVEAAILAKLPPRYFLLVEHLKRNGLIHIPGMRPAH